jgi:hypothetical protein
MTRWMLRTHDGNDAEVYVLSESAVERHLPLAKSVARFRIAEVEKARRYRLIDLVSELAREEHGRKVRQPHLDRENLARVSTWVTQGFDELRRIHRTTLALANADEEKIKG